MANKTKSTAAPATLPRGIRNCNPGNLIKTDDDWDGLAAAQTDERFFVFTAAKWGLRALLITLYRYRQRHKLDTVRGIIGRYAPSCENNTDSYVAAVCKSLGVGPDEGLAFDRRQVIGLAKAIVRHENGPPPADKKEWYPLDDYLEAEALAYQAIKKR